MAGDSQPPPPSVASPSPSASPPSTSTPPPSTAAPSLSSPYPYAFAPDIIRAHQKDAYFQGLLTNQITDLHRRLLGARSAHAWASESRSLADLLYLCLTTLLGNRTLGEEYCGLVQVEADTSALPALPRRAAYIAGSILFPYGLARVLPKIRGKIRAQLQRNLGLSPSGGDEDAEDITPAKLRARRSWSYKLQAYMLAHLSSITSPAPVHALGLALFYFSGSYYELAKRLAGLRYIFTQKVDESSDRAGYELLGVLLVVQMAVQGYLHVRSTLTSLSSSPTTVSHDPHAERGSRGLAVSLDPNVYASNNSLLPGSGGAAGAPQMRIDLALATHTPVPPSNEAARYDLADEAKMRWIKGAQQRKCTLCLEELKDPAATPCGHVFCWVCIVDWIREKPECPLCRREALVQHILPLRAL
ncbi:RING-1 like protein [Hypoxylon sp. FL1150]|nr:RING-1 like protein [Hypoxylon sp. FL1150]